MTPTERMKLAELAAGVAAALYHPNQAEAQTWRYVIPPESEADWGTRRIRRGDGAELVFHFDQRGRLTIRGEYPRSKSGEAYERDTVSISVSPARGIRAIAEEVRRRLLPDYLLKFAGAMERKRKTDEYDRQRDALADELIGCVGMTAHTEGRFSFYAQDAGSGEVEAHGDGTVSLRLRSIPAEQAKEILRLCYEAQLGVAK